jgi:hypothetical protein
MKDLKDRFASRMRRGSSAFVLLAIGWMLVPSTSRALVDPFFLSDHNSTFSGDLGSVTGANSWTVDLNNQLSQQGFWVQSSSGGPQALSQIDSLPYLTLGGTKQLTALYTNGGAYGAQLSYNLTGSGSGSGKSSLSEAVTLYNYTAVQQQLKLFMYADFVLNGLTADQYVQVGSGGGASTVVQSLGNLGVATNNFVVIGAASLSEVKLAPLTLNELTSSSPLTLNGSLSGGPGNYTWALEWDFTIAANGSAQISALDTLQVPEPSAAGLILLGLLAWRSRRLLPSGLSRLPFSTR